MKNKDYSNAKISVIYIVLTLGLTWLFQFMPMLLGMNIEDTTISTFDVSSVFFTIGGMMPSLLGGIFVLSFYSSDNKKDFFSRCFVPNKESFIMILIALALICVESFFTQMISKAMGAQPLGFEGLKLIIKNPLMLFYFLFWGLISGPLSEEFGWRGFLTDRLFVKNRTVTALIIGLIWGVWHLPLYFYPAQIQYTWFQVSPLLGLGFIINCMSNALVYQAVFIASKRKIFPIFFLHMFENIILTGAMIYPFSDIYSYVVIPVSIVIDVIFYVIFINTKMYKAAIKEEK